MPRIAVGKPQNRENINGLEDTVGLPDESPNTSSPNTPGGDAPDESIGFAGTLTDIHGGASASSRSAFDALRTVERHDYVVDCEIAKGGMGRITRARDCRHGRMVALKESLRPEPALIARFSREALITARLQHPAIVPVYEAGKWENGDPFYAMKLVDGHPLSCEIEKRTALAERMSLLPNLLTVTEALAYAHSRGVIHRDLKPANVIVGSFGETVVIDWGLAKQLQDTPSGDVDIEADELLTAFDSGNACSPRLTGAGNVIGTPAYMAPEQAAGRAVDQRADVYALGAIAYHALTGEPPYEGDSSDAVLSGVLAGPPKKLRERVPTLPIDLAAIIDKAMARDPDERYPSAKPLAEELRRFQTGQMVRSHDYSALDLFRRWLSRHRAAVAVAMVMLLAMLVLGVVAVDRILEERNLARDAHAHAKEMHAFAMSRQSEAEEILDDMLDDLRASTEGGHVDVLGNIADRVLQYYSDEARNHAERRDIRELERRLNGLQMAAEARQRRGEQDGALHGYRQSMETARQLRRKQPKKHELTLFIGRNHNKIAGILTAKGDTEAARAAYQQGIEAVEAMLPTEGERESDERVRAQLAEMYSQLSLIQLMDSDIEGWRTANQNSQKHARTIIARSEHKRAASPVPTDTPTPTQPPEKPRFDVPVTGNERPGAADTQAGRRDGEAGFGIQGAASASIEGGVLEIQLRAEDRERIAKMAEVAPEHNVSLSLDNLANNINARADGADRVFDKLAASMTKHENELGRQAARRALAKIRLKQARTWAPEDPERALTYANQCVDILEGTEADDALDAPEQRTLEQARIVRDNLQQRD